MNTPVIWKVKKFSELSTEELYWIIELRIAVFVIEQNTPYQDTDGDDQQALHLWAEQDGKIVAYCRLFDKGIKYPQASIGRVVTHPDYRAQKLGRALLRIALDTLATNFGSPDIKISAQNYLLDFYSSFGFQAVGDSYLEDNIPHTAMIRK